MQTEELLRAGRLDEALSSLEGQIRADPANAKLRVFLFQLLSVLGDWDRALNQLNVSAELDAMNLLMAQVCRAALNCEAFRAEVFAGRRSPLLFGEPAQWLGWLVQANQMAAEGKHKASRKLREQAFEGAPAIPGSVDGERFEWISDADSRLGPVLEVLVDGKYYWAPFTAIRCIRIEAPTDLRDVVWVPANFTWVNGGEAAGLIPTRYPGSEASEDNAIRLARKTEWIEQPGELYQGLGQRVFATDSNEFSILEVRQIDLDHSETDQQGGETNNG
ncbi:MAG TPA: type VI secretion system accessory protein TagJ [Sedimentisphaerales bacterium]|nr:type VI secretion system accessory protein TagJ [Sedimentisphaerales bacterium]